MLNCLATVSPSMPDSSMARIVSTSLADSLCVGLFSPLILFRIVLSRMLSACVPNRKCDGLTQEGTSQECSTCAPFGISPKCNSHDTRCARHGLALYVRYCMPMLITPYPSLSTGPFQSQQVVNGTSSTLFQNFSRIGEAIAGLLPESVIGQRPGALQRSRLRSL